MWDSNIPFLCWVWIPEIEFSTQQPTTTINKQDTSHHNESAEMTGLVTAKGHANMRCHIAAISMPLMERVCIAGIPPIVCTRIVGGFLT